MRVVENDRTRPPARRRARHAPQERGAGPPLAAARARWRRSSRTPAAACCRTSTSCSRPTCPARSRRSRTRSRSCRSPRSRSQVVLSGVGGITESDIMLAAASDAIVLGFNVRPVGEAAPGRRPRGRGDPDLLGHLPRDRRAARRHAGHARARGGRGDASAPSRCARSSAPRASARSPAATSPTARSRAARSAASSATARSSTTADRVAAARVGGRARGRVRLRVRHRAAQLRRREGGRRDRGLRHPAGRAHSSRRVSDAFVVLLRVHLHFPDSGSLKAKRAELNASRRICASGWAPPWPRSPTRTPGSARRSPWPSPGGSAGRCDEAADAIVRALDARFPQGVRVDRCLASWSDLEALG